MIYARATIGKAVVKDGVVLQLTYPDKDVAFRVMEKADAKDFADFHRNLGRAVCYMPENVVAEQSPNWWIGIECASAGGVAAWGRAEVTVAA